MKKHSWRRLVSCQMAAILLCLIFSTGWIVWNYYRQMYRSYQQENQAALTSWSRLTTTRLNSARDHMYEIMLTIYTNQSDLGVNAQRMEFTLRQKLLNSMKDKLSTGDNITFFYIQDTASGNLLFTAVNNIPAREVSAAKVWVRSGNMVTTTSSDRSWQLVTLGTGKNYFTKNYALGRYRIGAMCDLEAFDAGKEMHILGESYTMFLQDGESRLLVGGETLWETLEEQELLKETRNRWISSADLSIAGAQIVLVVQAYALKDILSSSSGILLTMVLLTLSLFVLLMYRMKRSIIEPTEALVLATQRIRQGDLDYRIDGEANSTEFDSLYHSFNAMTGEIRNLKIEAYDRELRRSQEELVMMRAQLRPHFYLNAITTVSNMTYQNRQEDIRDYLRRLAKYMRYMMNLNTKMIPLGVELDQIRSYIDMQKLRFPNSVDPFIGCPAKLEQTEVPFLMVFTVVENTFKHAMDLYKPLKLLVQCEAIDSPEFHGCRVVVEDNGKGFSQEVLDMFLPERGIPEAKEHIGLSNVSRTLQLTYHRSDLLHLSNSPSGGARVEILIPMNDEKETRCNEATNL